MNFTLGICGSRNYTDYSFFSKVVKDELERLGGMVTEIITGDCTGTDAMALDWAMSDGYMYTVYCASRYNWIRMQRDGINAILCSDWKLDGKLHDLRRNRLLVEDADSILLFDEGGKNSRSVLQLATKMGRPIEVWQIHPWECGGDHSRSEAVV